MSFTIWIMKRAVAFFGFSSLAEIGWHVAEATVLTKTKRGGEGTHGRNEVIIRRQDLQVLGSRHPLFLRWILWRCSQQKEGYCE